MRIGTTLVAVLFCTTVAISAAGQSRRALLIGINDYTASRWTPAPVPRVSHDREWPNLNGAVNDVGELQEMLVHLFGFERANIRTLVDQAATRTAILSALENLAQTATKDEVVLFYFAGHGSQVRNSLSDERDKLDESIVAADSRAGAADIRDKELSTYFNRILDRGARLTVILDNCHSGSGARGLPTGARPRGIKPDLRDVADRVIVPAPESRGALVFSAAQDTNEAWEARDPKSGNFHGAFTWALMRAIRDADAGEPAIETFLRAEARLRGETPFQEPVLAGLIETKLAPLLGVRNDRREGRTVVAVERVQSDGTLILNGGWANGLTAASELQLGGGAARATITAIRGVGQSEARITNGVDEIRPGALLEVVAWAAPPENPLRVSTPSVAKSLKQIAALAHTFAAEAAKQRVRWVVDPSDAALTHLLRRGASGWELYETSSSDIEHLPSDDAAIAAIAKLPLGSSLFVQLPIPSTLIDSINMKRAGVALTDSAEDAGYILVGRLSSQRLSYAWVRPAMRRSDRRLSGLPLRTAWVSESGKDNRARRMAVTLTDALARLRRIHAWQQLESPPSARYPYQLALRRVRDGVLARDSVIENESYEIVLRVRSLPFPQRVPQRFIYVFAIDSSGKSTLLFPEVSAGSVENRFPTAKDAPYPTEIVLGEKSQFAIGPPFGVDTYYLLSTDQPLPDPSILEWDGIRAPPQSNDPLTKILALTAAGARSVSMLTPPSWSIDRVVYESIARHKSKRAVSAR